MSSLVYDLNAPDADLILLSSTPTSKKFLVHKCILATASPFFKDMFTLPQPATSSLDPKFDNDIPVIPVSESAHVLEKVLHLLYPSPDPPVGTLDELCEILNVAVKYDFSSIISSLRKLLISPRFVESHPLRVFAIAVRFDFEEEARLASRFTLTVNVLDCQPPEDLIHISAYSYHRLLDLHRRRAAASQQLLKDSEADRIKCMQCNAPLRYGVVSQPKWWIEFETRALAELAMRPTTNVIFGLGFLAGAAQATGCLRCPGSLLDSHRFLAELRKRIDELPDTI